MKTIITIQHTQAEHHLNGMVGSWTDWPLTALGLQQAERIGERLRTELAGKRVALYASDLRRAAQTAACVGERLGVEPIPRRELRERNLGRCCGQSVAWLREHMTGPERTVDDRLFPDAESRRDAWNRLEPFFQEIMRGPDETVLIVSHGDLLGSFHAMFLGLDVEALARVSISGPAGGVSWLEADGAERRVLRRLGDLSYLT